MVTWLSQERGTVNSPLTECEFSTCGHIRRVNIEVGHSYTNKEQYDAQRGNGDSAST